MEFNKRKFVIWFLALGIMLFFIGMATNIALGPTTDTNKLPQQVSSVIKLTGMGFACIALLIGGIFVTEFPLEHRGLMILFGFLMLVINIIMMSVLKYY